MKKLLLFAALINIPLQAMDFATRFGPNSPAYNEPLYFSAQHMIARPDKKTKSRKYRDRLKKQNTKIKRKIAAELE